MLIEYVVMGLQNALLFACLATAEVWALYKEWTPSFHWEEKMTMKNPENNPTFNYPELGSLQDAWKVLEETSTDTYFLLFRAAVPVKKKCISATVKITDKTNKTATHIIMIYDTQKKKYENTTIQVRALNQADYPLENVIRANFNGKLPNATPVPPGSYTYAEYDNSTCYSRSTPFPNKGNAVSSWQGARHHGESAKNVLNDLFPSPESGDYADMYVVYNEPQCYILRSSAAEGGCDLWLRKTELKKIVDDLEDELITKKEEIYKKNKEELGIYENCTATDDQKEDLERYVEDDFETLLHDVVWERISLDCVLAFMINCGTPLYRVSDPITCNTTLTGQYV
ncbi:uncharacterized protein LOC115324381, partial [Ixodes scapularis]|uniref:uncharacterized protein LOC115324381 n=1 Tax=Ixodes scapularis TaxID=6945 RepID=UPI001C393EFA